MCFFGLGAAITSLFGGGAAAGTAAAGTAAATTTAATSGASILSTAATLGSTVLGAAGAIQSANAQAAAGEYNAKVQEMNATLADRRARDAIERGKAEEQRKRMQVSGLIGAQKAAMAANGVDIGWGSPLDTITDTATLGELDALTIRSNSYREAYDYQVEGVNQRAGAGMSRAGAKNATSAGYLGAAGTVLTGLGKAYQQYNSPLAA